MLKPSAKTMQACTNLIFINDALKEKETTWLFVVPILSSNNCNHTAEFQLNIPELLDFIYNTGTTTTCK